MNNFSRPNPESLLEGHQNISRTSASPLISLRCWPRFEFSGHSPAFSLVEKEIQFSISRILIHPTIPSVAQSRLKPFGQTQEVVFLEIFDRALDLFNSADRGNLSKNPLIRRSADGFCPATTHDQIPQLMRGESPQHRGPAESESFCVRILSRLEHLTAVHLRTGGDVATLGNQQELPTPKSDATLSKSLKLAPHE